MIGSYPPDGPLPPRVREVLNGAARGETMRETASRLHISAPTVDKQRRVAIQRLGARNLPNAIALAARQGLLDP